MKTVHKLLMLLAIVFAGGCDNTLEIDTPVFDITETSIKDDTDETGQPVKKVTFHIAGNPDLISFYSGEVLHDYNYREGRTVSTKELNMSFSTNAKLNSGTIAIPDQLAVLVSTDFSGKYEEADIAAATWTDISSGFTLSPVVTHDNFLPSGTVNLLDYAVEGKPLYIAFRYLTPAQTAARRHVQWRIRDFAVRMVTDLASTVVASQSSAPWTLYHKGPFESGRSATNTSQLILRGNNTSKNFPEPTEDWAISRAIEVAEETDLGPDRPIAIKARGDAPLTSFTYQYPASGQYKVVFVASNVNIEKEKKIVKELDLNIP